MSTNVRIPGVATPLGDLRSGQEPPEHEFLNFKELFALARRRLRFMVTFVLLITGLVWVYTLYSPKFYSATATLVLERKDARPYDGLPGTIGTTLDRDRTAAETEVAIMTSRGTIGRLVDRYDLVSDPHFNPFLPPVKPDQANLNLYDKARQFSHKVFKRTTAIIQDLTGLDLSGGANGPMPPVEVQRDRTISTMLAQVAAQRTGESLAITLRVTTYDPQLAMKLTNGLTDVYLEGSLEEKNDPHSDADLESRSTQTYLIQLRNQEAQLQRERAQLSQSLDVNHPKLVALDGSIASVRGLIKLELQRLGVDLQNAAKKPSARVVSPATLPTDVAFPKPSLMIAVAGIGSALLAIALAFVLESADKRIRAGNRATKVSGFRHIAYVPRVPRRLGFSRNTFHYLQDRPRSAFAVGVRSVYMAARMLKAERPRQAVMVVSCLPEEGKTSMSLGLALAAAQDECKTVIVDCDFYRPGVLRMVSAEIGGMTLEDLLADKCQLRDAIVEYPGLPNLHLLGMKRPMTDSSRHSTQRIQKLIETLRSEYDFIVIDTPPMLTVDDANWMSPLMDGVIMVVRWASTTEEALAEAAEQLTMAGAPVVGTVINGVDVRTQERHGYGGSPQYYRQSRKYLTN
jgi:capsular exopolysaccharide synthesis family protein